MSSALLLAGLLVAAGPISAPISAPISGPISGPVFGPVFTVQDDRIDENSGMVDLGSLTVVTNDSGDTGRLFVLDGSGRTVGVTTYADEATDPAIDVEALAPARGHAVWVGDIGDNDAERDDVVVRRVPVARGERSVDVASYHLVYPDGPHDAETLLRDPRSGRLYVVTKAFSGGRVYAAPRRLDPDGENRLTPVAEADVYATDGAFLPGGRRVLVRSYADVKLFAFPSWRLLATYPLPAQEQGESLSIGPGQRVRIGSEGEQQPVLQVSLPLDDRGATASPAGAGDIHSGGHETGQMDGGTEHDFWWPVGGAVLVLGTGAVLARRRARG